MISKLIINADDFGMTREVTRAIVDAHKTGVVTSTTLMGNCDMNVLVDAQEISRKYPDLGIGVHLVLTTGSPLLKTHKTLGDGSGRFRFKHEPIDESIDLEEVYEEWKAQIERIKELIPITHFDSHHHVHTNPLLQPLAIRLGREFKLPMRWHKARKYRNVYCANGFYGDVSLEMMTDILRKHHGLVDVMVHPGYGDDEYLAMISSYTDQRHEEFKILTSAELKAFIEENKIDLVNYRYVKKH